ncbi:MAG: hypothetical protein Q8R37_03700 [Nanoarchaeota archaeon]|nr:hypothetical protein [Nanoarchaeota archaeon]
MKIVSIIALLLISMLVISCTQGNKQIADFKKEGIGEVDVSRQESYFPRTAHQGDTFDMGLALINNAAYDAKDVRVVVAGFDNAFVDLIHEKEEKALIAGRSLFDQDGEEAQFQFQGVVNDLLGAEFKNQNYFIYLTYNSKMEFTPKPCIGLRQIYKNIQDQGCSIPEGATRYNGQGAPLTVESMEILPPSASGGEIKFILTLRNRGKGNINTVQLDKAMIANKELHCQFRGEPEMTKTVIFPEMKTLEVVCTALLETENRYTTTLFISFLYDYERVIQQSLELKR